MAFYHHPEIGVLCGDCLEETPDRSRFTICESPDDSIECTRCGATPAVDRKTMEQIAAGTVFADELIAILFGW